MSYQDAVKASVALCQMGFSCSYTPSGLWQLWNPSTKCTSQYTDAQLLAFAKSKGWEPKGDADE